MSPRASLPGAEELFRPTKAPRTEPRPRSAGQQDTKSTKLQVASPEPNAVPAKAPRHEEKVTFYCTAADLMAIEQTRLKLRAEHGIATDRGRIVRAALDYVLEDFEARSDDSILIRRLT